MFENFKLFSILPSSLKFLAEKEKVVTGNLVHANTPNYKALEVKDIPFESALGAHKKLPLVAHKTSGQHLSGKNSYHAASIPVKISEIKTHEAKMNGNTVKVEHESMKLSQVGTDYMAGMMLYRKYNSILKGLFGKN